MVALAVRALVFVGLVYVVRESGGGRSVLVEEFLECGQGLRLEFDEVVQFLVVLGADGIAESCSGFNIERAVSLVKGVTVST